MRAKVEYTCDYQSEDGNDQRGQTTVYPEDGSGGRVHATWSCTGGMGDGAELVENTTAWSDEEAEELVNSTDICQGVGTFLCDIGTDKHGWSTVENVEWVKE
jgi:hypothetical protein